MSILDIRLLGVAIIVLGLLLLWALYWYYRTPRNGYTQRTVIDFNRHESRAALRRIHGRQR